MILRDRLLAGEHHGCESWAAVARAFGCNDRALRKVREDLAAGGLVVALSFGEHETKPTVHIRAADSNIDIAITPAAASNPHDGLKWASVAAFDAGYTPDGDAAYTPPLPALPEGHRVRGVSTLVGPDGETKAQWIKTTAIDDSRQDWLTAIRDMGGELPRVEPVEPPARASADLLNVLPLGDPHVGLLSWREDSGENFDLDIAEHRLVNAFDHLLGLAPLAQECLIILIGDTAHADGQNNTTTKGTRVDVDGRIIKVARTILRICRHAIGLALKRHERVTMIVERGNHDELVSAMIALALGEHYSHEPRVTIDQSPAMFHWFRWGSVLIGTHHGDKVKPMDLLGVMAVDQAEAWSACKHRRFYLGHFHHQIVKEVPGLICEYLPTLASSDAWHHSMGYRSSKAMYLDVYHREHGHVDRHIVGLSQLGAA